MVTPHGEEGEEGGLLHLLECAQLVYIPLQYCHIVLLAFQYNIELTKTLSRASSNCLVILTDKNTRYTLRVFLLLSL